MIKNTLDASDLAGRPFGRPARSQRTTRAGLAGCALVIVASVMLGCGGGGDNGGTGTMPACVGFTAASPAASNAVSTRESSGSTCEVARLELVVTDVDDLFGASFTVTFDPAVVSFDGWSTSGSLLDSDGVDLELLEDVDAGVVKIGVSRFGVDTGVDVVGTRLLLTLLFRKAADSGATPLSYTNGKLIGSEPQPQVKPGVTWVGGTVFLR
jgi:hypothetical protein